jgi:hypothetical protein
MPTQDELIRAREGVSRADAQAREALTALAAIEARHRQRERSGETDEGALAQARKRLEGARDARRRARDALATLLAAAVPPEPGSEVDALEPSPIVLFPVRIETRFRGPSLLVRVYPDEIFADMHEPELTQKEIVAGQKFFANTDEALAWRELVASMPAERAAWVLRALSGTPEVKTGSWTRAAETRLLPDRFIVIGYRAGTEVGRWAMPPIIEPVALSHAPDAPDSELVDLSPSGPRIDRDLLWTFDFAEAERIGLALTISLSADDLRLGFDRLLVVGVKGSLAPPQATAELTALFDAHHYTRGLALVAQGTPTTNTSLAPAAYPPADPGGASSLEVERRQSYGDGDCDGKRLAHAFGLPSSVFERVRGALRDEQAPAGAMNEALFPATFGYFLEQMMSPVFDAGDIAMAKRHFIELVRGRGHLPCFRIGAVPYGVLPVSSIARWESPREGIERPLAPGLATLRTIWLSAAQSVARVGRGDPDEDLAQVLAQSASSRHVRIRRALGEWTQLNLLGMFGLPTTPWASTAELMARSALTAIGHPEWDPRVVRMQYDEAPFLYRAPLVAPRPLSEAAPLAFDYVDWIRRASFAELTAEALPAGVSKPTALLYHVLRHARLIELDRIGSGVLVDRGSIAAGMRREKELVDVASGDDHIGPWQRFETVVPGSALKLRDFIFEVPGSHSSDLAQYDAALGALTGMPTAELDRLFSETLDACAYRLDAWIASLPMKRLQELRARQAFPYLGAYGWVEDLRPRTGAAQSGGFIHAPTMNHAATAAILRNAYMTRSGESYAIDLSSARVRGAKAVLDAVRQGQPIGAVLGYAIERALHEIELERLIAPLRRHYPLVAEKGADTLQPGESVENVAARNVVDGRALREAFREGTIPFGTDPDLGLSASERAKADQALRGLDDAVDALADTLTSEAVHQLVRGSMTAAAASLDSLARGHRPPATDVTDLLRSGTTFTHRIALVLGDPPAAAPAGWPETLRGRVEPRVAAWVARVLGTPERYACRVTYTTEDGLAHTTEVSLDALGMGPLEVIALFGAPSASTESATTEIHRRVLAVALGDQAGVTRVTVSLTESSNPHSFAALAEAAGRIHDFLSRTRALRAADLALPEEASAPSPVRGAEALQRAAAARSGVGTIVSQLSGAYGTFEASRVEADGAALRTALAEAARTGLEGAIAPPRSWHPAAERASLLATAAAAILELQKRASQTTVPADIAHWNGLRIAIEAARDALLASVSDATILSLRSALSAAAVPQAEPPVSPTDFGVECDALLAHARSVIERLEQTLATLPDATPGPSETEMAERAQSLARGMFGAAFPFVVLFAPGSGAEIDQALAHSPALVGDVNAVRTFWLQAGRVRPALGALRFVEVYARTLGAAIPVPTMVQLPHVPAARWIGGKLASDADRPPSGRVSIAMLRESSPGGAGDWAGLLVDEWVETIPSPTEQTGIAFHYDDPGAEAPQAVLIAVPPRVRSWSFDDLAATLLETMDLARIRLVTTADLAPLAQLVPTTFVAANVDNATIGVDFHPLVASLGVLATERGP